MHPIIIHYCIILHVARTVFTPRMCQGIHKLKLKKYWYHPSNHVQSCRVFIVGALSRFVYAPVCKLISGKRSVLVWQALPDFGCFWFIRVRRAYWLVLYFLPCNSLNWLWYYCFMINVHMELSWRYIPKIPIHLGIIDVLY